jgi:DNA polymerase I-like protein with 3'-5' exonuclease and polymerase domains
MKSIPWQDSLIAHHAYASHLPQRLDQLASEYLTASPWKIKHGRRGQEEKGQLPKDMTPEDLALYNGIDCRVTIRAWERMQLDLAKERQIYEADMRLSLVCQKMMMAGMGVDFERKAELSTYLKHRANAIKGELRKVVGKDFQPSKPAEVRRALYTVLGAKPTRFTPSGLPGTGTEILEVLAASPDTPVGHFASLMLRWRLPMKIRSTYIGGASVSLQWDEKILNPHTRRAHYGWKAYGTETGRLASRIQSCPRRESGPDNLYLAMPEERVREIYAAGPGRRLVYWDVSQAEARIAAFLSADPVFMAACRGDVHANNAKNVFKEAAAAGWLDGDNKKTLGKKFRDIAKNLGFAIAYGAEAEKLFMTLQQKGYTEISYQRCVAILAHLRIAYRVYYKWAETNVAAVRKVGYMRSPFAGRIRHFGHYPKVTEVYNYPIQSGLADIMNERMVVIDGRLPPGCKMVAQIHDACIIDCPENKADAVSALIADVWAPPVKTPGGDMYLPIDAKQGIRWSDF